MLALVPIHQTVAQEGPTEVWALEGFNGPESVVHDAERGELYVSNVAGAPGEKNGAGFVSRLSPDGEMLEAEWVTGLDAPKGSRSTVARFTSATSTGWSPSTSRRAK